MPWPDRSTAAAFALAIAAAFGSTAAVAAEAAEPPSAPLPKLDEADALRAGQAAIGRVVGDYTLLDRQGRPVRLADYRGKPLLVSFVYTGCFQVCPANTRLLLDAVKGLDGLFGPERYRVVSIGFNQPFDSPTAMRAFAAQHRIDRTNWEFLSPPAAIVEPLTRDLGFRFVATPAGFDHVVGVTLLDGQGRVHSQVYGERVNAAQLGEPLKALLGGAAGSGEGAGLRLTDVIERARILCTVYDAETGQYRTNWALLAELIGGGGFFLTVIGYGLAERRERRRLAQSAQAQALPMPATGTTH